MKKLVRKVLHHFKIWFYAPVQMGMGVVGIPDYVCCKPTMITEDMVGKVFGLFMAVEVKAPGKLGSLTPNQEARIDEIRAAGGIALVVDDADVLFNYLKEKQWERDGTGSRLRVDGIPQS